jgi:hypothetical protein
MVAALRMEDPGDETAIMLPSLPARIRFQFEEGIL